MNQSKLFFGCLFIICLFNFCNQGETGGSDSSSINFVKTLEGEIGGKYKICMKLKSDEGDLKGKYFYMKNGTDIKLKGKINSEGKIKLKEYDSKNNQTGIFKGKLNNGKFEGKWRKPDGSSKKPFSLIESNTNYKVQQGEVLESKIQGLSGEYSYQTEYSKGKAIIKHLNDRRISFKLTIGEKDGCMEDIKGKVTLATNLTGEFDKENCNLIFKFANNYLKVKEKSCDYHGMGCTFGGKYHKQ